MLRRIRVKDFQSLGDVDLELGGFTAIVGPSDIGKSALLRALRAVVTNPAGTDVIRNGSKQAKVAIDIEDPEGRTSVVWEKGASASYSVVDADEASVGTYEFDKVRPSNVPDEVRAALRLGTMSLAGMDIDPNYHAQHEAPFLLAAPPSVRSRLLGEVTGAAILMGAVADAKKADSMAKREQSVRLSDKEKLEGRLREFRYLVDVRQQLDAAAGMVRELRELGALRADIADKLAKLEHATGVVEAAGVVVADAALGIAALGEVLRDLDRLSTTIGDLGQRLSEYNDAVTAHSLMLTNRDKLERELEEVQAGIAAIPTCPTCGQAVSA